MTTLPQTILAVMLAVVATATSASSNTASERQPPATGTIIVYRHQSLVVSDFGKMKFSIDGGNFIHLKNGHYYRLVVSAGDHVLTRNGMGTKDPQRVHVEANQTIFFAYYLVPFMGIIFEKAEDQEEAKTQVSQL
jgi:hypothetical protein